jgi:hypothetical protein
MRGNGLVAHISSIHDVEGIVLLIDMTIASWWALLLLCLDDAE